MVRVRLIRRHTRRRIASRYDYDAIVGKNKIIEILQQYSFFTSLDSRKVVERPVVANAQVKDANVRRRTTYASHRLQHEFVIDAIKTIIDHRVFGNDGVEKGTPASCLGQIIVCLAVSEDHARGDERAMIAHGCSRGILRIELPTAIWSEPQMIARNTRINYGNTRQRARIDRRRGDLSRSYGGSYPEGDLRGGNREKGGMYRLNREKVLRDCTNRLPSGPPPKPVAAREVSTSASQFLSVAPRKEICDDS